MAEFIRTGRMHDTVFDVDVERLARVYAEAAMAAAGGPKEQDALMEELDSLKKDVLDKEPKLVELMASELVAEEDKLALVDRIFAGRTSTTLLHTLKVLAKHHRLGLIQAVIAAARKLWEHRSGRLPVELETAEPLEGELAQEVLAELRKVLNADPIVYARVNPDLIAGFIVRVGDRVFDGSTRTRLEKMRQAMIGRAVDAIQSKPEQFVSA
jgi:F-type H+-transporting ATPase subunit delta